jgi:hypothetical protein
MVTAGACALVAAGPAQAGPWHPHNTTNNNTNTNTNTNTTNTSTNSNPFSNPFGNPFTVNKVTQPTASLVPPTTTVAPIPTDITIPNYGNVPRTLNNTGLGVNPQTCPGNNCYQPIATSPLPIGGTPVTLTSTTVSNGTTKTVVVTTTIPSNANNTFPVVANQNGTGTTIQLPTLSFG